MASMMVYLFPWLGNLPLWNAKGFIAVLILHVGVAEPLFYVFHRYFHTHYFFTHYHSLHHSSPVPQSFTGNPTIIMKSSFGVFYLFLVLNLKVLFFLVGFCCSNEAANGTVLEHLGLSMVIGAPILGTSLLGYGSTAMIFSYVLVFDFLRCLGHSNVEIIPHRLFQAFPIFKYLLYTPT